MRVSDQWLRTLVALPWTEEEVAAVLTHLGFEVEAVEDWRGKYRGCVVGVVREGRPHKGREGLWVYRIAVGDESVQVVAGAVLPEGGHVVVALPGAVVPQLGRPVEPRSIEGEDSHAMVCSRWELALGEEADQIWLLPADAPVGVPLADYLPPVEDVVYEVAVTPNRGDCLSHLGIARELAAYGGLSVELPAPAPLEGEPAPVEVVVAAPEGCPLYACCVVDVSAESSPLWLQVRLWRLGIRPHMLPVDVMNYVMLERGQPLHAFDYATIAQHQIHVRWARPGERFHGLDGRTYTLCSEDLLIADPEKPLALAGVLGGAESEVGPETERILIESALFHPVRIRRTARRHALETEAAYRFQRGVDPCGVLSALSRAVEILHQLGGKIGTAPVVVGQQSNHRRSIAVRYERIGKVLGITLSREQVHTVVTRLGFDVLATDEHSCTLAVPSFRSDIREEVDVIEEVARLYGYDRIPVAASVALPVQVPALPPELSPPAIRELLITALTEWGFQQVFTPVLTDPEAVCPWEPHPIRLVNALGLEYSTLRPTLVPSLVRVLSFNVRVGERTVRIFELGKVFHRGGGDGNRLEDYRERLQLGILLSGMAAPLQWGIPQRAVDFYDLRGVVEQLLERLRIPTVAVVPWEEGRPHPVLPAAVQFYSGGHYLGWAGQLRPSWLKGWEVEQEAFVAVLEVAALQECQQSAPTYAAVPPYPAIRRDVAFVVEETVPVSTLLQLIRQAGGEWLEEVVLFDVFRSPSFGEGKRSLAFALRFRSRQRTLQEEDITPVVERIIATVEHHTGARLRA